MKYLVLFFLFVIAKTHAQDHNPVQAFQDKLNNEFKDPALSPLPAKERENFTSLEFFTYKSEYRVLADFVRTPFEVPFKMATTTDRKPLYVKFGELHLELKGKELVLDVFQNLNPKNGYEDHLFLPFTDLTNGDTSYTGGRYIDLKIPFSLKVVLDFNKAYNPYCAYNGEFSCPIVPKENHLDLKIPVGVKAYNYSLKEP